MTAKSSPFVWCGPVYEPTGYADEARGILRALEQAGVPVALRPLLKERPGFRESLNAADQQLFARQQQRSIEPPLIVCQHITADSFVQDSSAAYNVGRSMFETDSLPPSWVQCCNDMDELWVPSTFNRESFAAAGVRTPIHVVPGGIDVERYHPNVAPMSIAGARGTVFLSVFEWRYRKGWDVLLRAWANAFGPDDDVSLVLRTYPQGAHDVRDRAAVIDSAIDAFLETSCGRMRNDVAPIIPVTRMLSDAELPGLYTRADAYVSPTRGEGWGRPFMEAMASGRPTLATRWSAHLDFMHDENSLLIDVERIVDANDPDMSLYDGQRWAEPSVAHLATLLQRVHRDRAEAREIGRVARADMASEWGWDRAAKAIASRLRELGAQRATMITASTSKARVERPAVVIDADLFSQTRTPCELDAWLTPLLASDPTCLVSPRDATTLRPSRSSPRQLWWARRVSNVAASREVPRALTVSLMRRSDTGLPLPPTSGQWIVMTGDVVGTAVPPDARPILLSADAVWVPHEAARRACLETGVCDEALWIMPTFGMPVLAGERLARAPRPVGGGTVYGVVVGSESELPVVDALVRTWERAFTGRTEWALRVMLASAPSAGVQAWHMQLRDRLAAPARGAVARVEAWPTPVSDDLWPMTLRSLDVLIAPSSVPAAAGLWSLAMAAGVPLIAPDVAPPTSPTWQVPLAATGRFNWSAFAAAVESAADESIRRPRAAALQQQALELYSKNDAYVQAIRARLDLIRSSPAGIRSARPI